MAKLTLTDLASLANETSFLAQLNQNFADIEAAIEITLSRDGTLPNTMSADLDMNSNDINNVGQISCSNILIDGLEIASVADLAAQATLAQASATAAQVAQTAAELAETNAEAAQAAAEAAAAGLSLPSIVGGDANKLLKVNAGETGYELVADLPADSVPTVAIEDGAVTTAKINAAAVTSEKIADGAVGEEKLGTTLRVAKQLAQVSVAGGASEDLPTVFSDNPYDFYMVVLSNVVTTGTSTGLQLQVTDDSGVSYETTGYSGGAAGYSLTSANVNAGSERVNSIIKFQAFGNLGDGKTYIVDITQITTSTSSGAELASVLAEYAGATTPTGFRVLSKDATNLDALGTITVYGSDMPF